MLVVRSDIHVLGSPLVSGVVTRMQDLASEFSKFSGVITRTPTVEKKDLLLNPLDRHVAGHKRPGVVTQTSVPFNFSAVVAPLIMVG